MGPYKVKGIISSNAIKLELFKSIKIHLVVNVSKVRLYKPQVEGQKKIPPKLVIIKEEEEFKSGITKGVHGKIDIWMGKKEVQKRKRKEVG